MKATLIAQWRDTRATKQEVHYRLSSGRPPYGRDVHYTVERLERDALGGDRWVVVDTWSNEDKNVQSLLAILAESYRGTVDELERVKAELKAAHIKTGDVTSQLCELQLAHDSLRRRMGTL